MRTRISLQWTPCWEGATKNWAKGFLLKNRWRCDRIHEIDDLLQDAYLTFLKIADRYPRVMGQAHFMTLYRRAMANEMHDRSRYMRRKRELHQDTSVDAVEISAERIGEVSNSGYVNLLIDQAPDDLKLALECLVHNPPELIHQRWHRENLNMGLRRVLGYDRARLDEYRNIDFTGGIKNLLEA